MSLRRVLLLTSTFLPEYGAAPLRLGDLAYFMAKQDIQTDVITAYPHYPKGVIDTSYQKKRWFISQEHTQNLDIVRLPVYPSHSNRFGVRMLTMLSLGMSMSLYLPYYLFKKNPDLVFVQSPPPLFLLIAWITAKIKDIPLIINVSDIWSEAFPALGIRKATSFIRAWEKFFFSRADAFVVQSEEIKDWLQSYVSTSTPILVHKTGVCTDRFSPKTDYAFEEPFKLVYAGVLGMAHGLADLCKNMNFAQWGVELHLYGNGTERQKIASIIQQNPTKGIFLLDDISPQEIPKLLVRYDAALITQKTYLPGTVPAKLYEAFAAGLPVLLMGAGEGVGLVQKHNAGFCVQPTDYEGLRKVLVSLKTMSASERKQMGENGRTAALKEYNRAVLLPQLVDFLRNRSK